MKADPVGTHWENCRWVLGHTRMFVDAACAVIDRVRPALRDRGCTAGCQYRSGNEFCSACYSYVVEQLVPPCAECQGQPLYHRCQDCSAAILTKAHGFCGECATTMSMALTDTSTERVLAYTWGRPILGRPAVPCVTCWSDRRVSNALYAPSHEELVFGPYNEHLSDDDDDESDDGADEYEVIEKTVPELPGDRTAARQTLSYYLPLFRSEGMINRIRACSWLLCASCRFANCETLCEPCLNIVYKQLPFSGHSDCDEKPLGDRCAGCMSQLLVRAHGFCGDCASRLAAHVADGQPLNSRDHMFPCATCWEARPDAIELVIGPDPRDAQAQDVERKAALMAEAQRVAAKYGPRGFDQRVRDETLNLDAAIPGISPLSFLPEASMYVTTAYPPPPAQWSPAIRVVQTQEDGRGYAIEFTDGDDHFRVTSFSRVQYVEQLNGQDALGHPQWLAVQEGVELLIAKAALYAATSNIQVADSLQPGQPPVDLLGPRTQIAQQAERMGAPTLSGLAMAYGATLLGRKD